VARCGAEQTVVTGTDGRDTQALGAHTQPPGEMES